jgi:hypothetical protein
MTAAKETPEARTTNARASATAQFGRHDRHCFIAMPYGRSKREREAFGGWYSAVLEPAAREVGLEPVLAVALQYPVAVTSEMCEHLAADAVAVGDLGGFRTKDEPNPNVMYEVGIRHALRLPIVLLALEGQRLPFDIGAQRVLFYKRETSHKNIAYVKRELASFLTAALEGIFYTPFASLAHQAPQPTKQSPGIDVVQRTLRASQFGPFCVNSWWIWFGKRTGVPSHEVFEAVIEATSIEHFLRLCQAPTSAEASIWRELGRADEALHLLSELNLVRDALRLPRLPVPSDA